jgi:hypothetical protein
MAARDRGTMTTTTTRTKGGKFPAHEEPAPSRRSHLDGDYRACGPVGNGKADLSGDMALRIEKAFGVQMDTLMRMQASYDIAKTRKREKQIHVRRIHRIAPVHA